MHPVTKTVLVRLGYGLLTLFVVSIVIFSAIEFLPGDFTQAILGQILSYCYICVRSSFIIVIYTQLMQKMGFVGFYRAVLEMCVSV